MISLFMMLLMTISLSILLYINGIWVYYYFQCLDLYPYLVTTAYGDLSGMYSEIKWLITIYHLVIFFMSVIGITLVFHINKYMALNVIPKLNSREFKVVILLLVLELILLIICFIINYYHDYLGGNILMSGIENMSIKDLHPQWTYNSDVSVLESKEYWIEYQLNRVWKMLGFSFDHIKDIQVWRYYSYKLCYIELIIWFVLCAVSTLFSNITYNIPSKALEGSIFMTLPLIVLAIFSIFFGYITKDIFIGLGSAFFATDNSIFIHPIHEIMLDTEFAVPTLFKLLPLIFTISLSIIAIVLSEFPFFQTKILIRFKLSRLGYNIFSFFNLRFLIEMFYNKYITNLVLKLGGQTKVLDKGSVEYLGPFGLEEALLSLSENIASLNRGVITSYALYILIGLIIYILIPYISLIDNSLFLLLFLCLASLSYNMNSNRLPSSSKDEKLETAE